MFLARPTRLHTVYVYGGVETALQPWQELFECSDRNSPIACADNRRQKHIKTVKPPQDRISRLQANPGLCDVLSLDEDSGDDFFESSQNDAIADWYIVVAARKSSIGLCCEAKGAR